MNTPVGLLLRATDGGARLGRLSTPHGDMETPAFMPVGTGATVKGLTPAQLAEVGAGMLLANTYHLMQRPGADIVAKAGGLHGFMGYPGPILTDSGGYQVFSLALRRKLTERGAAFQSHIDGTRFELTPESCMAIQMQLGADVAMVLDECIAYPATRAYARDATLRSLRWAARCKQAHTRADQALFGIVQGGMYADLRRESALGLVDLDFPGYGVGGLSVGEPHDLKLEMLQITTEALPEDKPRYLMGVGTPLDFVECVDRGVDMFDCVMPTRLARNATLYTGTGRLNIRRNEFRDDMRPLDEACDCYTCQHFSRAYLRHLFISGELLSSVLATMHNVRFFLRFMEQAREAIRTGGWAAFRDEQRAIWPAPKGDAANDPDATP